MQAVYCGQFSCGQADYADHRRDSWWDTGKGSRLVKMFGANGIDRSFGDILSLIVTDEL